MALPTLLDLDQNLEIPVKVGAREFKLTHQSYPVLRKIALFIDSDLTGEKELKAEEILDRNYHESLALVALMFGCEKEDAEKKEVVAFLKEHLNPSKVLKIFETWWELNEADDFFIRAGKMLMQPDVAQAMKEARKKLLTESG